MTLSLIKYVMYIYIYISCYVIRFKQHLSKGLEIIIYK